MRVALVGDFPLHPGGFDSGAQTSTMHLIEGLRTFEDMEIHMVACTPILRKYVCIRRDDVTYHYLPSPERLETLTLFMVDRRRVSRVLSEIRPDIVHAQNSQGYGYICLRTGYPVVLSIHGILQEEAKYIDEPVARLRALVASRLVQQYCVRKAPHVIQPTRYPEQYFGNLRTGKWYDAPNAIAAKYFDVASKTENGRLLYSGTVIRRKRLLDLIKALAEIKTRLRNVSLRVAGATPDEKYLRTIKEFIATYDLEESVKFLGVLTPTQLVEEYAKCALLVLPSGQETSPMVIAEAMAVGKPVVATRVGGVPYLVDDGQTGFVVDVGDVEALTSRILTILSDNELQSSMGRLAKEKASLNYRSEIVATRVRQVYYEAIEAANLHEGATYGQNNHRLRRAFCGAWRRRRTSSV